MNNAANQIVINKSNGLSSANNQHKINQVSRGGYNANVLNRNNKMIRFGISTNFERVHVGGNEGARYKSCDMRGAGCGNDKYYYRKDKNNRFGTGNNCRVGYDCN